MYQKLIIVGHLGRDPEMRFTPSGQAVTNFNVATSRKWTNDNGQQQEETIWFRVSAWGKRAEVCNQYLSKGSKVMIEGRLTADRQTGGPSVWRDQDGNHRATYTVTALDVRFLSSRSDSGHPAQSDDGGWNEGPGITEDEIPF